MTDEIAEFREALRRERRDSREAATAFVTACEQGSVDMLYEAVDRLNYTVDSWRLAFTHIGKLPGVSPDIEAAFLPVWIESKMLPLKVGNRRVLANALRLLLPGGYEGPPLRVFRGASAQERRYRRYGFSWTTDRDIARNFAESWMGSFGGVVMETVAPADAILLVRHPEDYYDEGEVVVDPFRLGNIGCVERVSPDQSAR